MVTTTKAIGPDGGGVPAARLGSGTVGRLRAPGGPGRWTAPVVLLLPLVLLAGAGCGAAPGPAPVPPPSASAAPDPSVSVPADGLPLRAFGYTSGPLDTFSLPRSTVLVTSVDQPDNVTAVLSAPSAVELAAYLRRALPAAGFTVTAGAEGAGPTLTFAGRGWTGSVTGAGGTAAVLLRPG